MANLSQAQIEMYARAAGMTNPQVMAAIAMAESGGNPRAHNPIPPDNSYGLWQVNMLGSMGPARRKQFGINSNSQLFDPAINAKAAAQILKSQGLKAWSTYTNGAYKKYMGKTGGTSQAGLWDDWNDPWNLWPDDSGTPPPESPWESLTGSDPSETFAGITDVAQLGVKIAEWTSNPRNWLNVLYVAGGGLLVLVTLSATVRQQIMGPVKNLGKVVKK